jgi:Flp pilus assembly protein TadD
MPGGKKAGAIAAFAAVTLTAAMVAVTGFQLQFWRNSEALFTRALAVTGPNAIADNNLATALLARGAGEEALPHILRAAQLRPEDEEMAYNAGNVLAGLRRDDEAKAWFERAIGLNPRFALARTNLGALLIRQGRLGEAIAQLETATSLAPASAVTRLNLAVALARAGRTSEAAARVDEALHLAPGSLEMRTKAVQAFWTMGLRDRALRELEWVRGVNGHLADELAKWMAAKKVD